MANYVFRNAETVQVFFAGTRLGTRVLNALEELRAAGHPLEIQMDTLEEIEDERGYCVRIAVKGVREPGFHYEAGVGETFEKHGVAISVFGQSIND